MRDENGRLTRAGMEQVIKGGGSVITPDGKLITRIADLPKDEAPKPKAVEPKIEPKPTPEPVVEETKKTPEPPKRR